LHITTELVKLSAARVGFEYEVVRAGTDQVLATGSSEHAAIDSGGRPCRLPQELRELLGAGAAS